MPQFKYKAIDSEGRDVSGQVEAASAEAAAAELEASGHREIAVEPEVPAGEASVTGGAGEAPVAGGAQKAWLREDDFLTIGDTVTTLTAAGLPLESGLRALAEDVRSSRTARALRSISDRLDKGETWKAIVAEGQTRVPEPLASLFGAGLSPGDFSQAITGYLNYVRRGAEVGRKIRNGLWYSCLLLGLLVFVVFFYLMVPFPEMMEVFEGFGMDLPATTNQIGRVSLALKGQSLQLLAGGGMLVLACSLLKYLPGRALRSRLWTAVPWVGPAYRLKSLSTFCHVMGVLAGRNVPLGTALRVAAAGCRNADIERAAAAVTAELKQGIPLEEAVRSEFAFPERVAEILGGAGGGAAFEDVLHAAGATFEGEARTRADLIPVLVEPAVLMLIVSVAAALALAIYSPLIKLLKDLS